MLERDQDDAIAADAEFWILGYDLVDKDGKAIKSSIDRSLDVPGQCCDLLHSACSNQSQWFN